MVAVSSKLFTNIEGVLPAEMVSPESCAILPHLQSLQSSLHGLAPPYKPLRLDERGLCGNFIFMMLCCMKSQPGLWHAFPSSNSFLRTSPASTHLPLTHYQLAQSTIRSVWLMQATRHHLPRFTITDDCRDQAACLDSTRFRHDSCRRKQVLACSEPNSRTTMTGGRRYETLYDVRKHQHMMGGPHK